MRPARGKLTSGNGCMPAIRTNVVGVVPWFLGPKRSWIIAFHMHGFATLLMLMLRGTFGSSTGIPVTVSRQNETSTC